MKIEHIIKYGEKPKPDIVLGEGLREVTLSPKERRRLPKEKETLALRNEKKDAKKELQIGMEEVQEREDIRGLVKDEKKFLKESEYKKYPNRRSGQTHHSIPPHKTEPYRGGKETRPPIDNAA